MDPFISEGAGPRGSMDSFRLLTALAGDAGNLNTHPLGVYRILRLQLNKVEKGALFAARRFPHLPAGISSMATDRKQASLRQMQAGFGPQPENYSS